MVIFYFLLLDYLVLHVAVLCNVNISRFISDVWICQRVLIQQIWSTMTILLTCCVPS